MALYIFFFFVDPQGVIKRQKSARFGSVGSDELGEPTVDMPGWAKEFRILIYRPTDRPT